MNKDILPSLVDRLRRLRGLSLRELAEDAGISSPSNLREWIQGLPSRLSNERIVRVQGALGLDPETGSLRSGLHRWQIDEGHRSLVPSVLPLLFPDRLRVHGGRSSSPVLRTSWVLLVRDSVRVLMGVAVSGEEGGVPFEDLIASSRWTVSPTLAETELSPENLSSLAQGDLSVPDLDRMFHVAALPTGWTYERLFERLWTDNIEPDEAARRLGFF